MPATALSLVSSAPSTGLLSPPLRNHSLPLSPDAWKAMGSHEACLGVRGFLPFHINFRNRTGSLAEPGGVIIRTALNLWA